MRRFIVLASACALVSLGVAQGAPPDPGVNVATGNLVLGDASHHHGSRIELRHALLVGAIHTSRVTFQGVAQIPVVGGDSGFQEPGPQYYIEPFVIRGRTLGGREFRASCTGAVVGGPDATYSRGHLVLSGSCSGGWVGLRKWPFGIVIDVTSPVASVGSIFYPAFAVGTFTTP